VGYTTLLFITLILHSQFELKHLFYTHDEEIDKAKIMLVTTQIPWCDI